MKKMNNKGVTLVELIVSFAIVGVALVYFYQTISTVSKLYKTSRDATNNFADATYVLRLMDAYCNEKHDGKYRCGDTATQADVDKVKLFCKKINGEDCNIDGLSPNVTDSQKIGYKYYKILNMEIGEKKYNLLALVTSPVTYEIKFYNGATLVSSVSTNTWDFDENALQTPSTLNSNSNRFQSITTGASGNITYKLYYQADNGYKVYYGMTVSKEDMESYAEKVENEGNITYSLAVKVKTGNLFNYGGNYKVIDDGSKNWRIDFLSSGTLTFFTDISAQAFLVGGGAGGASSPTAAVNYGAAGGAGGEVKELSMSFVNNSNYSLTIGSGGAGGTTGGTAAGNGTATTAFGNTADGGLAPTNGNRAVCHGGNCGPGGYAYENHKLFAEKGPYCGGPGTKIGATYYGSGGSGGVGQDGGTYWSGIENHNCTSTTAGKGGISSSRNGSNAVEYTGSGGGGAAARNRVGGTTYNGGKGSSGIVIIRNPR